jgi:hypothetical protein
MNSWLVYMAQRFEPWNLEHCDEGVGQYTASTNVGLTDCASGCQAKAVEATNDLNAAAGGTGQPGVTFESIYTNADQCQHHPKNPTPGFPYKTDPSDYVQQLENTGSLNDACLINTPVCDMGDEQLKANCAGNFWPGLDCS